MEQRTQILKQRFVLQKGAVEVDNKEATWARKHSGESPGGGSRMLKVLAKVSVRTLSNSKPVETGLGEK